MNLRSRRDTIVVVYLFQLRCETLFLFLSVKCPGPLPSNVFASGHTETEACIDLESRVGYGGMDERYAINKTMASRLNDPCSGIAALR